MAKYKVDIVIQAFFNDIIMPQLSETCEDIIFPIQVFSRRNS
jgi:hypothetical protein